MRIPKGDTTASHDLSSKEASGSKKIINITGSKGLVRKNYRKKINNNDTEKKRCNENITFLH